MSPNSNAVLWSSWSLSQWVHPFCAPAVSTNAPRASTRYAGHDLEKDSAPDTALKVINLS